MIKEKLFTLNRFTRKFVIWLYSKRENGEWRSKTLRELFKNIETSMQDMHLTAGLVKELTDLSL